MLGDNGLFPPALFAGHSQGEYTALVPAEVLDFATTINLTRERGRLMYEAGLTRPGAMLAIIGLDEALVVEICQEAGTEIANFNCPGQLVVSETEKNIAKAADLATKKGAPRIIPLPVSGAFHTSLIQPAVDGMAEVLADITFQNPDIPIIATRTTTASGFSTCDMTLIGSEEILVDALTGTPRLSAPKDGVAVTP